MPAKIDYLSTPGQRALKITAGIIGGFMVTTFLHLSVGAWMEDKAPMILTTAYTSFLSWVFFMILAFLAKNGWRIWGIYLGITTICSLLIYLGQS